MTDNISVFSQPAYVDSSKYGYKTKGHAGKVILALIGIIIFLLGIVCTFIGITFVKNSNADISEHDVLVVNDDNNVLKEKQITVNYVSSILNDVSSLVTEKADYKSELSVSEGKIPLLTKKGFTMSYSGYVKAGVNLSKAKIEISGHVITIRLPEPEITDKYIDPQSIIIYDKKRAVFNWSEDTDVTYAIAYAEQDMESKAIADNILSQAEENAENVLSDAFDEISDDYKVKIVWQTMS